MKKIFKIIICICMLPLNVFACPHIDKGGSPHLQTYNEDYTEVNMIYPMDSYLYVRKTTMTVQDYLAIANEDDLIDETFSFPVVQDYEDYLTYYWFLDETLIEGDESKVDVTVENIDALEVSSDNYKLLVSFSETYKSGQVYKNQYTEQIYYDVKVNDVTSDKQSFITSNNITLASNNIYDISATYTVIENNNYNYSTEYEKIDNFHDDIKVYLNASSVSENIAAINLNNDLVSGNYIDVTNENGMYAFTVNEPGIYTLVEKNLPAGEQQNIETEEEVTEENNENEENTDSLVIEEKEEKEENSSLKYIIIGVSALILVGLIVLAIKS